MYSMASQPPSNVVNPLPDSKRARMGPGPVNGEFPVSADAQQMMLNPRSIPQMPHSQEHLRARPSSTGYLHSQQQRFPPQQQFVHHSGYHGGNLHTAGAYGSQVTGTRMTMHPGQHPQMNRVNPSYPPTNMTYPNQYHQQGLSLIHI